MTLTENSGEGPPSGRVVQDAALLRLSDVSKRFKLRSLGGIWGRNLTVSAVDQVSLHLESAETLALVGESGCGKSTTARLALGMLRPDEGSILYRGRSISRMSREEFKMEFRRKVQAIFQDPSASLNPRKSIYQTIRSAMDLYGLTSRSVAERDVSLLLEEVGLRPGSQYLHRRPHELSGGQQQRVAIARALAVKPEVLIADEPVSSLDVSVRGHILNILRRLKDTNGISVLLITHDLGVVRSVAQRVLVMYLGRVVEEGPTREVFRTPRHPYTQAMLEATPRPVPSAARPHPALRGEPPSAVDPPSGCRFRTRCPIAIDMCAEEQPILREVDISKVACHLA